LAAGFAVALVACGGVLAARVSRGDLTVALAAHIALTIAMLTMLRPQWSGCARDRVAAMRLTVQIVGAAAAIVLAHAGVREFATRAFPWLSERPCQLVNDAVVVFAPLAVVWASSRHRPSTPVLVATLLLVSAYRLTASLWHLDAARYSYSVQDFVTGEFAGLALGVATFRLLVPA
jgi:hypothetical protein